MSIRIGHISDLHVLDIPREEIRPHRFLNKRLVGGMNLLLHRSNAHSVAVVHRALERLEELEVDHICITGDLTNLAMDSEFAAAHGVVSSIVEAHRRVSVIPGNHDAYTYEAERSQRFEQHFKDFLHSDIPALQGGRGYPFCHLRGDVAIIGLSSAIATPPLFATGRVDDEQMRLLPRLLEHEEVVGKFKLVMIHHPLTPFELAKSDHFRRLTNAPELLHLLRRAGANLVIHGHNHHISTQELPHLEGTGSLFICEAGSTSVREYSNPRFAGSFNVFEIDHGELQRIEVHVYDGYEDSFVHWHEETYERVISR